MPGDLDSRTKTCGWCGAKLGVNFYRDLARVRGFFCSGDHCMKFIENNNQPNVAGLKEDELESLHEINQQGYATYEERDA